MKHSYRKFLLYVFFLLSFVSFFAGCTVPSALRGSLSGSVMYTDCPPDAAFEIVCQSVARQGYVIDIKNDFNYFIRGYSVCLTNSRKKHFYVHVEVVPQPVGSKIISRLDEFHDTEAVKFLGIYGGISNKLAEEIASGLTKRNYDVQRL